MRELDLIQWPVLLIDWNTLHRIQPRLYRNTWRSGTRLDVLWLWRPVPYHHTVCADVSGMSEHRKSPEGTTGHFLFLDRRQYCQILS